MPGGGKKGHTLDKRLLVKDGEFQEVNGNGDNMEKRLLETLRFDIKVLRKLIAEVENFGYNRYYDNDGHEIYFFCVEDSDCISVSTYNNKNKKLSEIGISIKYKCNYVDKVYEHKYWGSDNLIFRNGSDNVVFNPDVNGKDKEFVFKILNQIRSYIDKHKEYRNEKEKRDQEFPSIVKYKKLFDELSKPNNRKGYPRENETGAWRIIRRDNRNAPIDSIKFKIDGHTYHLDRNWIDGKLTLYLFLGENNSLKYELNEEEQEQVLEIIDKIIKGDKSVKIEDFPPGFIEFLNKSKTTCKKSLVKYFP